MANESPPNTSTRMEWQDVIIISDEVSPENRVKMEQSLDKIQGTHMGQLILSGIETKMNSPSQLDGVFKGEMVFLTDQPVYPEYDLSGKGRVNAVNKDLHTGSVTISLKHDDLHSVRFGSTDGGYFSMPYDELVMHELSHVADNQAVSLYKGALDAADQVKEIDKAMKGLDQQIRDTNSTLFQEAPQEIQDKVRALRALEDTTATISDSEQKILFPNENTPKKPDMHKPTEGSMIRTGKQSKLMLEWDIDIYVGNLPEHKALLERMQGLHGTIDRNRLDLEDFAIATTNAYRSEKAMMAGKKVEEAEHRGHYENSYFREYDPQNNEYDFPDHGDVKRAHAQNKQWEEQYGAPPTSAEEFMQRYGDRLTPYSGLVRELHERENGILQDPIVPENPRVQAPEGKDQTMAAHLPRFEVSDVPENQPVTASQVPDESGRSPDVRIP